jgi:rhodanese-related sulfurtransferase
MDTATNVPPAISIRALQDLLGTPAAPHIVDVRHRAAFDMDPRILPAAWRREPEHVVEWAARLPRDRAIVVYCAHGYEISQHVAATLATRGFDARFLDGGIERWKVAGAPTLLKRPSAGIPGDRPSRWITRERPKIDRIACPWLIRRFIDPGAEFLYVPAGDVLAASLQQGALPYDVPDVEFAHDGELCSFDAFLRRFGIADPCLDALAAIVRGADTGKPELTPQSAGLLAVSLGLSVNFPDDHAMLEHGMVIYDALYAWLCFAHAGNRNADLMAKS